jgi:two-component sensor histidine kinase
VAALRSILNCRGQNAPWAASGTNAIKHGSGRITVTLAPSGKGHALSVSNDGAELPEGFDPTASKGLGMTLVSSLVRQIGGELRIDRGDEGDCTRFTVLFA